MIIIKKILLFILIFVILLFGVLFVGKAPQRKNIIWGVTFSTKYAENLGLDWKEVYSLLIDDLGTKNIRIIAYWDEVQPMRDKYNFESLSYQIKIAEQKGIDLIVILGMKTPRWPECHIPEWAQDLNKEEQQELILEMIEVIVNEYKESSVISHWQIENEPFLDFGECSWKDKDFLLKEIALVRDLDDRPIIVTESGELSTWFPAAKIADVVGTTMYRRTWWHKAGGFYAKYPIPPVHYYRKATLIKNFFKKDVICVELQAEPWAPSPTYIASLEEQEKTMDLSMFNDNIRYAEKSGLSVFYFWGAEWWYWMKEKNSQPEIWERAKELFSE